MVQLKTLCRVSYPTVTLKNYLRVHNARHFEPISEHDQNYNDDVSISHSPGEHLGLS